MRCAVTNLQFELCVCSIIYDDLFETEQMVNKEWIKELIKFIDGFVALSKLKTAKLA